MPLSDILGHDFSDEYQMLHLVNYQLRLSTVKICIKRDQRVKKRCKLKI